MAKKVVAGIVRKDDKILLCRKDSLDYYIFPGGKPDKQDRNDIDTLAREVREELNCNIRIIKYMKLFYGYAPNGDAIEVVVYEIALLSEPTTNAEIVELKWYDYKNPEKLDYPFTSMTVKVLNYLKDMDVRDNHPVIKQETYDAFKHEIGKTCEKHGLSFYANKYGDLTIEPYSDSISDNPLNDADLQFINLEKGKSPNDAL